MYIININQYMQKINDCSRSVGKNTNVCTYISKFCDSKTLTNVSQCSRKFNTMTKGLDNYFGDECLNTFFSNKLSADKNYFLNKDSSEINRKTWKSILNSSIGVKNRWSCLKNHQHTDNKIAEALKLEVTQVAVELYDLLQDNYYLPKLRKCNYTLEREKHHLSNLFTRFHL